jgi:hypothetical protein
MPDEALFENVVAFVSETTGMRAERIHATTRLRRDCGVDGDDAAELVIKFSKQFCVDLAEFQFDRHFGPESSVNLFALIGNILSGGPNLVEICIEDLVVAARRGRWTYDRPDDGQAATKSK